MRTRIIAVIAAAAALSLSLAGVARAAATPTVVTMHAADITNATAVLHGTVNPRGVDTDYAFNYGVTPSYGTATKARSAGSGHGAIAVAVRIGGLEPGTTYHFQITGVSAAGSAAGADVTFTTTGKPPSTVTTGAPVGVGTEQAGVTGTIDPNGAPTTWYVQYGLTTGYGLQTYAQPLAAGSAADPVAATLYGLAPAKLFHYRIVAFHGAVVSYGADATFFTRPLHPPRAGLRARTAPSRERRAPYTFTTRGSLHGGRYIPAGDRCTGTVDVRYYSGRHRVATAVADVGADCTFAAQATFHHKHGRGRVRLRVLVAYAGNGYLRAGRTTDHVTVGR